MSKMQNINEKECRICGESASLNAFDTYKSIWFICNSCDNYYRQQKTKYPLEFLSNFPLPERIKGIFGKKQQGVDFYRYYDNFIESFLQSGERDKWTEANTTTNFLRYLAEDGISEGDLKNLKHLDISGEPAFLSYDLANKYGCDSSCTAFADNVAECIATKLKVPSFTYDFNSDELPFAIEKTRGTGFKYDIISAINCINFCTDLNWFADQSYNVLSDGGHLIFRSVVPTVAVPLRWMDDDYTYLTLYSSDYLSKIFTSAGYSLVTEFPDGSELWSFARNVIKRFLVRFYMLKNTSTNKWDEYDMQQHCLVHVFKKGN